MTVRFIYPVRPNNSPAGTWPLRDEGGQLLYFANFVLWNHLKDLFFLRSGSLTRGFRSRKRVQKYTLLHYPPNNHTTFFTEISQEKRKHPWKQCFTRGKKFQQKRGEKNQRRPEAPKTPRPAHNLLRQCGKTDPRIRLIRSADPFNPFRGMTLARAREPYYIAKSDETRTAEGEKTECEVFRTKGTSERKK